MRRPQFPGGSVHSVNFGAPVKVAGPVSLPSEHDIVLVLVARTGDSRFATLQNYQPGKSSQPQMHADKRGYSMRCPYSPAHQKGEWTRCINSMFICGHLGVKTFLGLV